MYHQFAIFLTGVFLFGLVLYLTGYSFRKRHYSSRWLPVNPLVFLFAAIGLLLLAAIFTALLGVENLLLAAALAGAVIMAFASPVAALSFFTALLITRPWELMQENSFLAVVPRSYAVLCLLSFLVHALKRRELKIRWSRACTLYVLLLLALFLAQRVP